MLRLEIVYLSGLTEIVDHPASHAFCDLREEFVGATSVRILSYTP